MRALATPWMAHLAEVETCLPLAGTGSRGFFDTTGVHPLIGLAIRIASDLTLPAFQHEQWQCRSIPGINADHTNIENPPNWESLGLRFLCVRTKLGNSCSALRFSAKGCVVLSLLRPTMGSED